MPLLPLPPLEVGGALDAGEPPVSAVRDVAALWAPEMAKLDSAPVRDAIQAGQFAALVAYQRRARYARAQSDPLAATEEYLDEIGQERACFRKASEDNESYRARVNASPSTVSPEDILAAANAAIASLTAVSCRYYERSDAVFASAPGVTTWSSHVFARTEGSANATPNYPDRLYDVIAARQPSGQVAFTGASGRLFVLRVPDLSPIDTAVSAAFQLGDPSPPETPAPGAGDPNPNPFNTPVFDCGNFVGDTSDGVGAQNIVFAWSIQVTSDIAFQAIIDAVETIRGQSIRWSLFSDPYLT